MTRFSEAIGQAIEFIIWTGRIGYDQKDRYTIHNQQDRHDLRERVCKGEQRGHE
jgi:hypothetical protein